MFTWKLVYLIFMPMFYKGLIMFILWDERKYQDNFFKNSIINLIWYYLVEAIYILVYYKMTEELIFAKNLKYSSCSFEIFVYCSIVFILCHLLFCLRDSYGPKIGLLHCGVLSILFLFFLGISASVDTKIINEQIFNDMKYEIIANEVYELEPFSDSNNYLNGSFQENCELYYYFWDENNSLTINHFTYNDNCKIYVEEDCINPSLQIKTYSKSYKDKTDTFQKYYLHIPNNNIETIIVAQN